MERLDDRCSPDSRRGSRGVVGKQDKTRIKLGAFLPSLLTTPWGCPATLVAQEPSLIHEPNRPDRWTRRYASSFPLLCWKNYPWSATLELSIPEGGILSILTLCVGNLNLFSSSDVDCLIDMSTFI